MKQIKTCLKIKMSNESPVKCVTDYRLINGIESVRSSDQSLVPHQVLPLDASLFSLPVQGAVRGVDQRGAGGHAGFLPRCFPPSGSRRQPRKLSKKSLILSIYAQDLIVGKRVVLPVPPSRTVDDQFVFKQTF